MCALMDEQKEHSKAVSAAATTEVPTEGQETSPIVDISFIETSRPLINLAYGFEKVDEGHNG